VVFSTFLTNLYTYLVSVSYMIKAYFWFLIYSVVILPFCEETNCEAVK
jgi:hypothetical protein